MAKTPVKKPVPFVAPPPPLAPYAAYRRLNPPAGIQIGADFGDRTGRDTPAVDVPPPRGQLTHNEEATGGTFYVGPDAPGSDTGAVSDTGADGAGGGKGTSAADTYFAMWGLPADVQAKVNDIFSKTSDPNEAAQIALAYIRGTPWYAQTYPGIKAGFAKGIVSNEADYRAYLNAVNQHTQTYLGRAATAADVEAGLNEGITPDVIGRRYAGRAYVNANVNDIQYAAGNFGDGRLSDDDLQAYGREQVGLDNPVGLKVQQAVQRAMTRYQSLFGGNLASAPLSLGPNGPSSPALLGQRQNPDVAA